MKIPGMAVDFQRLATPVPMGYASVSTTDWLAAALAVRDSGGAIDRLVGWRTGARSLGVCGVWRGRRLGLA